MNAEQQPPELHLVDEHARTNDRRARTPHRHLVARLTAAPPIAGSAQRQQRDAADDETSSSGFVRRTVMAPARARLPRELASRAGGLADVVCDHDRHLAQRELCA